MSGFRVAGLDRDPELEDVFEEVEDVELSAGGIAYKRFDRDQIRFGPFARDLDDLPEDAPTYYLTTAIAYTNGLPHVGHAYEFLTSDVLVRLHRFLGYKTFFLTGSDEHGQKVAGAAAKDGVEPLAHCNKYVSAFQRLNDKLRVTNDRYLRTTSAHHKRTCQLLWKRCADAGDIYLGKYEGWYNEREEAYVSQADAEKTNFMDVDKGVPLKRVSEESYFFAMSKYNDRLIQHIEQNPAFIQPESARSNILARLRKDPLKDLSISRTTFSWGIPLPPDFDQTGASCAHVMYVWFDALANYLTGVCAVDPEAVEHGRLQGFWPADRHIIGKDIIWFHCVYWPTMLMSVGLALPKGVFAHGFVNDKQGHKMSKSMGNSVDPDDVSPSLLLLLPLPLSPSFSLFLPLSHSFSLSFCPPVRLPLISTLAPPSPSPSSLSPHPTPPHPPFPFSLPPPTHRSCPSRARWTPCATT